MSAPLNTRWQELRALARLALPIALAQAGQAMMGFVDTAVVGRAGTASLAAVGLANGLFFAVSSFGMGLMMGLDPLLSQAVGAGQAARARGLVWQGLYLSLAVGTLLCLPLLLAAQALPLFGVAADQVAAAEAYLTWRAPSLPLMLAFLTARSYLQAVGRTTPLVVATVAANVFNLGADILFVFGGSALPGSGTWLHAFPPLGIRGAALATTLCTALQGAVVAEAIRRVRVAGPALPRTPVREDLVQAARVGWPVGLHLAAEIGVFALAGLIAGGLGPASISAHQIALSYASLSFTLALGIGAAGSVRVGWAVGARNSAQARASGLMAFAGGAALMGCSALLFALFPLPLARLANAPEDVVPLVVPLLVISAFFQLSDGVQAVGAGVLRGAGDTRFTFLANLLGHYAVGLPIALVLAFVFQLGVVGIWWGLCAGLTVVALGLLWRFHTLTRRALVPLAAA